MFIFDGAALSGRLSCLLDVFFSFNLRRYFFEMMCSKFNAVEFCTLCKILNTDGWLNCILLILVTTSLTEGSRHFVVPRISCLEN